MKRQLQHVHGQQAWHILPLAHLALVDGDGPGQFEGQLLATQVDPTTGFEHPALGLQHLSDAAQETHARVSWDGRANNKEFANWKNDKKLFA